MTSKAYEWVSEAKVFELLLTHGSSTKARFTNPCQFLFCLVIPWARAWGYKWDHDSGQGRRVSRGRSTRNFHLNVLPKHEAHVIVRLKVRHHVTDELKVRFRVTQISQGHPVLCEVWDEIFALRFEPWWVTRCFLIATRQECNQNGKRKNFMRLVCVKRKAGIQNKELSTLGKILVHSSKIKKWDGK